MICLDLAGKEFAILKTHWLTRTSILVWLIRISHNQFKCNYLRNGKVLPIFHCVSENPKIFRKLFNDSKLSMSIEIMTWHLKMLVTRRTIWSPDIICMCAYSLSLSCIRILQHIIIFRTGNIPVDKLRCWFYR